MSEDFSREVKRNQKVWESTLGVYPGESALFINGLQANLDVYDVFTLLDNLKDDAKIMKGLHSMGLKVRLSFRTKHNVLLTALCVSFSGRTSS